MKVSLNTIKQYTRVDLSVDALVKKINEQLGGVEEVIDLGVRYKDALIVKIISAESHPDADRLRVCKIDDGGARENVERDEQGYIQVVCGAPNAREGIFVVWLPPKSTVPASYNEKELFVLEPRQLRGVMSHGMLAASDELAIGSDHDGILEIDPNEWKPIDIAIAPGASFAKAYGLDDTIIDIENKMFTHRPDLFGQLGVAREIAGIQQQKFTSPEWYTKAPEFKSGEGLQLETFNDSPEKVPRLMTVAIKHITIKPSPLWLQCALVALGSKPINNIVDVTNYVMLLSAQPTHAYDYDKIRGAKIGARMAKKGETIALLNNKTYELDENDIVIADSEGPIGLGGIMGGKDSEVDANTTNIILEVATFDMYTVRKSSMRHGVFTDALTRFNKGQSPLQNPYVLNLLIQSIFDTAGGEQASGVFDLRDDGLLVKTSNSRVSYGNDFDKKPKVFDWKHVTGVNTIDSDFVNQRLGTSLTAAEIVELLKNVEFSANVEPEPNTPNEFEVIAPFWRTDLELDEDIVEEVGRLYGFDKLPRELPKRSIKPAAKNERLIAKALIRERLSRAGLNEVLTYSFVHENVMKRAGQNADVAFRLGNALSPDLQYYRLSLVPSLLEKVTMNARAGYDEFALFELGKGHHKSEMDETGLPREFDRVAGVYANSKPAKSAGAPYYSSQKFVMNLLAGFNRAHTATLTKLSDFEAPDYDPFHQMLAPFEPTRSAIVTVDSKLAGVVGEFKSDVAAAFKLPAHASGFELFLSPFLIEIEQAYSPLSKFPSVTQDVSLIVSQETPYQLVFEQAVRAIDDTKPANSTYTLSPMSLYAADNADVKTITLRLTISSHDRTLTDQDVTSIIDSITAQV